jgi:hypothetical protein
MTLTNLALDDCMYSNEPYSVQDLQGIPKVNLKPTLDEKLLGATGYYIRTDSS